MWYGVITTSRDIYFVYNWDLFNNEVRRERKSFMIFENSEVNEANNFSILEVSWYNFDQRKWLEHKTGYWLVPKEALVILFLGEGVGMGGSCLIGELKRLSVL